MDYDGDQAAIEERLFETLDGHLCRASHRLNDIIELQRDAGKSPGISRALRLVNAMIYSLRNSVEKGVESLPRDVRIPEARVVAETIVSKNAPSLFGTKEGDDLIRSIIVTIMIAQDDMLYNFDFKAKNSNER